MTAKSIALIEAGYRLESDDAAWVRGIADTAAELIDADQGLNVIFYDATDPSSVRLDRRSSFRSPVSPEAGANVAQRLPPSQVARLFPAVPNAQWISQTFAKSEDGRKVVAMTSVYGESFGVLCPSTPRRGLLLSLHSPELRTGKVSATTWLRIATHLSHAARLRSTLGTVDGALEVGPHDAVLADDGKVVHAAGEARADDARQALRAAARAVDRARSSKGDKDPDEALLTWKGLVEGRWSLVDQFDSDGRRFLVARRNEPAFRRPRALTLRERHVAALAAVGHPSKIIAYQLGVSTAAATATLTRALNKLGLQSRAELATIAGVLDPWGSEGR